MTRAQALRAARKMFGKWADVIDLDGRRAVGFWSPPGEKKLAFTVCGKGSNNFEAVEASKCWKTIGEGLC